MLFHSSLRKELARSFGATFVALLIIVMTMMLIRTLGLASKGNIDPTQVMMVLGYTVLGHLPTILTLSLFIAIVGTLSRMYRDSEMAIWFSSGRGLASFLPPLLHFAWPVLGVIAALALLVWPWSNLQTQEMRERFERRGDLQRVAPGQFQESATGHRVFFVEKAADEAGTGRNVFISSTENGKQSMTSARSGRVETRPQGQFLLLDNGQRIDQNLQDAPAANGARSVKISEFKEYGVIVGASPSGPQETTPPKARSTLALLREPTPANQGELAWRLGLALTALNFVVIAIAVASVNPRAGRSGNLLLSLFSFIVYYNLLNLGQSWISVGKVALLPFVLALHGGVLGLSLLWLAKRHNHWRLPGWSRARRSAEAAA